VNWHTSITAYESALRAAAKSPRTIDLYSGYLKRASIALAPAGPWEVSTQQLEELLGAMTGSASGKKSMRVALGGFYAWGVSRGHLLVDPVAPLPTPRVRRGKPRPTPEGVLLDALERADERARLMLELGALAGLRAGEIAQVHHYDLDETDVLLVHGKGGKERYVPLASGHLCDAIRATSSWLFPNVQRGGHLTPNYVSNILSGLLEGPWTAHTLRHRFGTRAFAGSRDLVAVSELLGHASLDTTRIYVMMPDDHLRTAVEAAAQIGGSVRRPAGGPPVVPPLAA